MAQSLSARRSLYMFLFTLTCSSLIETCAVKLCFTQFWKLLTVVLLGIFRFKPCRSWATPVISPLKNYDGRTITRRLERSLTTMITDPVLSLWLSWDALILMRIGMVVELHPFWRDLNAYTEPFARKFGVLCACKRGVWIFIVMFEPNSPTPGNQVLRFSCLVNDEYHAQKSTGPSSSSSSVCLPPRSAYWRTNCSNPISILLQRLLDMLFFALSGTIKPF